MILFCVIFELINIDTIPILKPYPGYKLSLQKVIKEVKIKLMYERSMYYNVIF